LKTHLVDFTHGGEIDGKYHVIVNTMTLHHVRDPGILLSDFFRLLHPGGRVGVADLDTEDGSFHRDNTGVFHFGFDRERLADLLRSVGFEEVRAVTAASFSKEVVGGGIKPFSVFLLVARRPLMARSIHL
jgi:2-polyprenyl-3-methyl-5-hydroxy-6-metoxy-1,4-benzoquinol methylase